MWEAVCITQGCGWSSGKQRGLLIVQEAANIHEQGNPGHKAIEREVGSTGQDDGGKER